MFGPVIEGIATSVLNIFNQYAIAVAFEVRVLSRIFRVVGTRCYPHWPDRHRSVVALLFNCSRDNSRQIFAVILRTNENVPSMSLIVLSTNQDCRRVVYKYVFDFHSGVTAQILTELQDRSRVLEIMTRQRVAPRIRQYVVWLSLEDHQTSKVPCISASPNLHVQCIQR